MKTAIELAREAGNDDLFDAMQVAFLERLVELARAEEREACEHAATVAISLCDDPVAAIRARGQ